MNLAALLHLYVACAVVCATTSACDGEPATVEELDLDDTTVVVFDVFDTLDCPDGFRSVAGACSEPRYLSRGGGCYRHPDDGAVWCFFAPEPDDEPQLARIPHTEGTHRLSSRHWIRDDGATVHLDYSTQTLTIAWWRGIVDGHRDMRFTAHGGWSKTSPGYDDWRASLQPPFASVVRWFWNFGECIEHLDGSWTCHRLVSGDLPPVTFDPREYQLVEPVKVRTDAGGWVGDSYVGILGVRGSRLVYHPDYDPDRSVVWTLPDAPEIRAVVTSASNHGLVLDAAGQVWLWTFTTKFKVDPLQFVPEFRRINLPEKAVEIGIGSRACARLVDDSYWCLPLGSSWDSTWSPDPPKQIVFEGPSIEEMFDNLQIVHLSPAESESTP